MSDEIKRIKDEEQANWEWDYDVEESDVLKMDESVSAESTSNKSFLKVALGFSIITGLVVLMAGSGFNFAGIGRFAWLVFVLPFFFGSRRPNWMGLTLLFFVITGFFSGTLWSMWWLIFLVPMAMGKQARSC